MKISKEDLIGQTERDIEFLKSEIKGGLEYIVRQANGALADIDKNPECLNGLGIFQGNAPQVDLKIGALREKLQALVLLKLLDK